MPSGGDARYDIQGCRGHLPISSRQVKRENAMRKIILISAITLLAACGGTSNDGSAGAGSGDTSASTAAPSATDSTGTTIASDDTIVVESFGDMPQECIDLLSAFLKQIEPTAAVIDWNTATLADFKTFTAQYKAESDSFDAQSLAAGCNKYSLSGSDEKQFEQMAELAAAEAPGAVGFVEFLGAISAGTAVTAGSIPSDCAGTIAAIEPYLGKGTMNALTMAEVTTLSQLMTGVRTNCSADESSAFFARADITAFVSG
jgi:hypothetical protein